MNRWFLIVCACLSITACSSTIDGATGSGGTSTPDVTPTIVAPAAAPEILAFTDGDEPLDVSRWDAADVAAHITSIRSRPHTIRSAGPVNDVIEIVDDDWRISTTGTNAADAATLGHFTIRGSDGAEWVTYGHVRAGTIALQRFAAASGGLDLDELLSDPDLADEPIVEYYLLQRALLAETAALETMWVPYERNEQSIFRASALDRNTVDALLDGAIDAIDTSAIERTTDALVAPIGPDSEFESLTIPLDRSAILLNTGNGWSLTIEPGVVDIDTVGAPSQHNVLTREVLLASTAVEDRCIAPRFEATVLVESGLVICEQPTSRPRSEETVLDE